jgi:hypothetical protein
VLQGSDEIVDLMLVAMTKFDESPGDYFKVSGAVTVCKPFMLQLKLVIA